MATLKQSYDQYQSKCLMEARVSLLEKGIYPFDVFLKESTEAINAAIKIEQLEEAVNKLKNQAPTLYMFVQQNSNVLLEGKGNISAIKATMVNYTFICEALNKCINEAVQLTAKKHSQEKTLYDVYKKDAVQLLRFCIQKAKAYNLMEGNVKPLVDMLASELSNISIKDLKALCESVPSMRLYVSNETHNKLATALLSG